MKYHIYALERTPDSEQLARGYECHLIAPQYILIYTAEGCPTGGQPVAPSALSARDAQWVMACNERIVQEALTHEPAVQRMAAFLDRLREELHAVQEMQKGDHCEERLSDLT